MAIKDACHATTHGLLNKLLHFEDYFLIISQESDGPGEGTERAVGHPRAPGNSVTEEDGPDRHHHAGAMTISGTVWGRQRGREGAVLTASQ